MRDTEVIDPDIAGWRRERLPEVPSDQRFEAVPDWVCEILSRATRRKDREIKMPLHARYGVAYAWLLDPIARRLETYALRGSEWEELGERGAGDTVDDEPFQAAVFRLADLWS